MELSYGSFAGRVEWPRRALRASVMALALLSGVLMAGFGPMLAATAARADASAPFRLAVLGDSLTAGYGLPAAAAFPERLKKSLADKGIAVDIINAGVSGDTASGGRDRLDWSIPDGTRAVLVELGANDALRGVDPSVTRAALDEIITRLQQRGIAVMLCGMYAPRNLGPDYVGKFDAIYPELAKAHDVPLYPFFLDGVAGDAKLTQPDGLHPTAAGVDVIVGRIMPSVEALLASRF
ncbi:arylesterase [Bradyrhizobium sp. WD16]|uniref:arylesterase n=1 Tax=Bradyrhizobium sp. WD16 TaxID=1521768 RepID=UPI0020A58222|nr:arylesterase [Bradyrhizobium sp. WD16]UTD26919.1 arylesterase [Bradyrhizobium sp. WD16]